MEAEIARLIGDNIARVRERTGLSQEEVGFRAAVHRTAVGQLERGERVPRADTVIRIAGALSVPAGKLLAGIAWESVTYAAGGYRADSGAGSTEVGGR